MTKYRVAFEDIPWAEPIPGVRHRIRDQEGRRLRLVEYTEAMEPHWCTRGHVGILLEGELEIRFDGSVEVYHAGEGVFIPSGPEHRHMARVVGGPVRALFVEDL